MRVKIFVAMAVFICACALVANAQETRGSVIGQVVDSSGAVIPSAAVNITSVESNFKQRSVTNNNGAYEFLYMLPGRYMLSAGGKGFKTSVLDVEIRINERTRVDLTLEVGAITEEVRVTAEAPQLQTANANLGQVIDARRVAELPLHDGSPYSILYFTPGVSDSGAGRVSQDPQNYDGASQGRGDTAAMREGPSYGVASGQSTKLADIALGTHLGISKFQASIRIESPPVSRTSDWSFVGSGTARLSFFIPHRNHFSPSMLRGHSENPRFGIFMNAVDHGIRESLEYRDPMSFQCLSQCQASAGTAC